ncbi:hypothetical protein H1P_130010 [Hyella patelloides LEGE 07179]|uniref:Uncharacterized protein n=1 Tax=Hyella patelloides LEGE 07179 TaxID=945734 RepID=A0A563VKK8_9CYAN|nr:hypothetical protein H1P_130010 [Hyella patelloides LEGE 07179]
MRISQAFDPLAQRDRGILSLGYNYFCLSPTYCSKPDH